jgi:hypothetical protein
MYQDLILKQKILKIKSKTLGDNKVNMQMVEKNLEMALSLFQNM